MAAEPRLMCVDDEDWAIGDCSLEEVMLATKRIKTDSFPRVNPRTGNSLRRKATHVRDGEKSVVSEIVSHATSSATGHSLFWLYSTLLAEKRNVGKVMSPLFIGELLC